MAGTTGANAVRPVPSPLWAGLAFSFVSSIGTGVVTNGIFFITKHAYRFGVVENYWLGVALGVTYVGASLGAGPFLRRLEARFSTRAVLAASLMVMSLVCTLPLLQLLATGRERASLWTIWTVVGIYSPLTGILWPVTESYISGGRSGAQLRSAVGRFNVTWAAALVASFWAMASLIEGRPEQVMAALGLVHLGSLVLLIPLGRDPGAHDPETHEPHPPVYRQLLVTLRVLLPTSYFVLTAMNPYLPTVLTRLGVQTNHQMLVASSWIIARVFVFAVFERWHGWHGRWLPVAFGAILMIAGFGSTVAADRIADGTSGVAIVVGGLAAFGVGMAVIYSAALYYAMEVGKAGVDAGGAHEALIGCGYALGPLCGLAGTAVATTENLDLMVLSSVAGIGSFAAAIATVRALRGHFAANGIERRGNQSTASR